MLLREQFRFPYDDESSVAHAGTPEGREYQIIGVLGDDEVPTQRHRHRGRAGIRISADKQRRQTNKAK